ncbi:MAG: CusA/CzcA family heavy metal efflux RND transporter [Caulobacter sp.]
MLSKLVAFSVRRRFAVVAATLAVAAFGAFELFKLPIDATPDITNKQVQVTTVAPALSPEEIEQRVTTPVETGLGGVPGLIETRSISRNGFSQITAVFEEGVDIYFARQQVAERLEAVRADLPADAKPAIAPVTTGLGEVMMWTVEYRPVKAPRAGVPGPQPDGGYLTPEGERLVSEKDKATYLRTVQDWIVTPQLRTTKGLAGVDAIGGYVKEYAVRPDPARLAAYGVGLNELVEAVEHANTVAGAGYVSRGGEAFVVRADARVTSLADLASAPVTNRDGLVVRVSDVAQVEIGQAARLGAAQENGEEVVIGTALMRAGENSRTVAKAVGERLKAIAPSLPPGVAIKTVLDRTDLVDRTIATVRKNLAEGALLVVVVLFLLLGNVRAAIITALVIPLAFLVGVIGMNRFGVSGNLMSLGALDFGLLVDGAVVVVESTLTRMGARRALEGRDLTLAERLEEAAGAAAKMAKPAAFGQAVILLVYAPLLALEGVEGKMFQPMAATVMLALAGAFVLTFTFVPAMTALLVKAPKSAHQETRVEALARRLVEPATRWAVERPLVVGLGAAGAVLVGLLTFLSLGREFMPTLDEKDVLVQALRTPSASLEQSIEMQGRLEKALLKVPEVAFVFSKTGTAEISTDPMPPSISDTFVVLKPTRDWPDRGLKKAQVVEKIEQAAAGQIGSAYEITQPIQMRFNELISGVRSDVAVKIYGDDLAALERTAGQVAAALGGIRGAADVRVEQVSGLPMITAEVDRAAAALYGLHAADAADAVQIALAGREAGRVFEGDRRFDVVVRLPDAARNDLAVVAQTPLAINDGTGFAPLGSVIRFKEGEGPNQISRENGKRRIVVQANVRGRDLGGFVEEAQGVVGAKVAPPSGGWFDWGGQFENLQRAEARLGLLVPAVALLIGGLLWMALGSARQAALVFACAPLALVGGTLALAARGMPFSVSAAVGFIAVSGISTLNGLVLLQAIRERMEAGAPPAAAAVEGAMSRLRAVLTTALVAMLGFLPMALAHGAGAEVQKPLATAVIGGLAVATLLTLVALPSLAARLARPKGA